MIRRFLALALLALPVVAQAQVLITPEPYISSSGVVSGQLFLTDGTAGAPSLAFGGDVDSGLYLSTAGQIGLSTAGGVRGIFTSDSIRYSSGGAGTPTFTYRNDTDTGRFLIGVGNEGLSVGGALVMDWEDTNAAGASANLATISSILGIMDGSDTFNGLSIELTNVDHTGVGNVVNAISIANITGDADATENALNFGTGYDADIEAAGDLALTVDGLDLGVWKVAQGTLTATQVRKLNATPVEVIAAPGSGKAIWLESAQLNLDWLSIAYDDDDAGEDFAFSYVTGNQEVASCDNISCLNVDAVANVSGYATNISANGRFLLDNDAIEISIKVGEIAAADNDANGNSPIHYLIRFREVTLAITP